MSNTLITGHPKTGENVTLVCDDKFKLVSATYDDGEAVELTDRCLFDFQHDINFFIKGDD
jgi:hypothetical protein